MARGRLRTPLTLLGGAVGGYLVALSLQEPSAPTDSADAAPQRPPTVNAPRWPIQAPRTSRATVAGAEPATLADILTIDGEFEQTAALYELIRAAEREQLERLIVEADGISSASDRRGALSILYARYADLDPDTALGFLLRHGASQSGVEARALFHGWARRDLTAAVETAAELPPHLRQAAALAILMSRDELPADARQDVARRLEVEHLLGSLRMQRALDQVDRDPLAAWQTALAATDGPGRQERLMSIVNGWARREPLAAMEAVRSLANGGLKTQLQQLIVHQWGQSHPREAVDWVLSQPPSPQRGTLTATALGALAGADPRTAFDLAQSLAGRERAEAVGRVLSTWAQHDPAAAAAAAELAPGSAVRHGALFGVAAAYAREDPEGALQWVSRLDIADSGMAVSVVFNTLAQQDPMEAARRVDLLPEAARGHAVSSVASTWAQQDPAAAARWAETLADDDLRTGALVNAVQAWAGYERDAAVRFAGNLPAAAERDAALVAILQTQHHDAEFGERILERLTDPQQRATAARLLYSSLLETDPDRAERYRALGGVVESRATLEALP